MFIRKINKNDKTSIIKMMEEFYNSPAVLHPVSSKNFSCTVDEFLNGSPYIDIFIAEINEKPIGYVQTSITWSNEAGGLAVWLEEIFIKENFRSGGYGSEIIDFIKKNYKNAARFRLEIEPSNIRAEKLYNKKGFDKLNYLQMSADRDTKND